MIVEDFSHVARVCKYSAVSSMDVEALTRGPGTGDHKVGDEWGFMFILYTDARNNSVISFTIASLPAMS